ncbi:MAG: phosphoribosylglycinamide formyltransferase [Hyphomicrobiales bacterium]|jgi:phosphoribosylglycinamide formyltransferase 1|nr:phosphoribosylglycinamide formyltransferase [Hyphomicrobiales bacterium]|tara:strand:+ start:1746 stop:2351 length:606 start_codon:yes stop_codon:yes gene_type:complete
MKKRVAILISGRGSNMEALIRAAQDHNYPATIELVISNKDSALGLQVANSYGIDTKTVIRKNFNSDQEFDDHISNILLQVQIDIICTAGYMKILTKKFVDEWMNKIINIHPSLLPSYKGLNTHRRALEDGARVTGCTTHIVRAELDSGPIIMQESVHIEKDDDEDTLAAKVLKLEHRIFPESLQKIASGKLIIKDNIVLEN